MKYLILLSVLLFAGCSTTTPSRMSLDDLNYYQIDCSRRDEQLAFIRSQMPTRNERYMNALQMTSMIGVASSIHNGTYADDRGTFDRRQESIARVIIHQIEFNCPPLPPQPQGCVHIREDMPAGSSTGARCYSDGKTTPIVNRWEVK